MVLIVRKHLGRQAKCNSWIKSCLFRQRPGPERVPRVAQRACLSKGRCLKGQHTRRTPHDSKGLMGCAEGNRALYSQPGASRTWLGYRHEQGYATEASRPRYGRLGNRTSLQSNCFRKIEAMGCVFQ